MRAKSTLVTLSVLLLVLLFGGVSGAVAGTMITGKQIKNGTVTGIDLKNGSVTGADLSASTKAALRGRVGPTGAPGTSGISNWQMVHADNAPQPTNTYFQHVAATCPGGTKLLSATARWHVWDQSMIAVRYFDDGTGAEATVNDPSISADDYIDLTLICATVNS